MVRLPVFGIFNVCTDVDASDCTWGVEGGGGEGGWTLRGSALELDSGRKTTCRIATGDSTPHQYCTRLFSQTLFQPLKKFHMLLFAGTDTLPAELSLPLIMILKALLVGSACRFAQPLGQPPSHESDG